MDTEDSIQDSKKPHRERHSGRKAEKKKLKKDHNEELGAKQRNPKAFTFNSAIRAERRFRRTQDLQSKKEHIPVVDRTTLEPPPILVAIVGPPKVGKSTLIHSLIKSYTRQPLSSIKGPVTIVSGKKRRITLFECNNDINSMVDIAKVADLVLLLIDASFGFEMEIFEFLNICQVHGMPKVMGVLTHLDMLKRAKKLQRTKKLLKRRFWTEVYAGAKLFYLSGILHGEYLRNEIKNLARFISVMKFRPLTWQTTHPYVLADRMEDLTPPEQLRTDPKCERSISLYGYMRGIPMNKNSYIHIPGCGDFLLHDICFLPDPCPLPEQIKKRSLIEKERLVYAPFSGVGGIIYDKDAVYIEVSGSKTNKQNEPGQDLIRSLLETRETINEKLAKSKLRLFSHSKPMTSLEFMEAQKKNTETVSDSNLLESNASGGEEDTSGERNSSKRKWLLDSDCSDFEAGNNQENNDHSEKVDDESSDEAESNISGEFIKKTKENLLEENTEHEESARYRCFQTENDKLIQAKVKAALRAIEANKDTSKVDKWSDCSSESDEEPNEDESSSKVEIESSVPWDNTGLDESSSDSSDTEPEANTDLNWKSNLAQKAAKAFFERQSTNANLWKQVYGEPTCSEQNDVKQDGDVGGLFTIVKEKQENILKSKETLDGFDSSKYVILQKRDWSCPEIQDTIKDCFVTGKWNKGEDASELLKLDDMDDPEEELFGDFEDLETGEKYVSKDSGGGENHENNKLSKDDLLEKKKKLKEKFDCEYDTKDEISYFEELKSEANKQAEINRNQFEGMDNNVRVQLEGYRAGMYVRVEIKKVPWELVEYFDASYPLIIGGLQPGEQNVGFVKVQMKKHRWYGKILKTFDPLIMSMGWRRFQTVVVYSKQEDNMRHRMLKYTPEHVACMGHFWGPITKAGTGFVALQSAASRQVEFGFRIAATGSVVDTSQSTVVTKKLKLIGTPMKIFTKTAFVQGMFSSALEVAKFEGAKIKTVSGIRGQIKKAVNQPDGAFRAKFEDKILLSDIVFCRTWYQINIPKFYTPVTTLLLSPDEKNSWIGMKTLGQLKRERGIRNKAEPDSMYTEVKRNVKVINPLVLPRALEKGLPYEFKTKSIKKGENKDTNIVGAFSKKIRNIVVRNEYESKVSSMMNKLRMCFENKQEKSKEETRKRVIEHFKLKKAEERKRFQKQKEVKREIFRTLSKYSSKQKTLHKKSKK